MSANLVKARSYIVFIVGLLVAFGLVVWIEHSSRRSTPATAVVSPIEYSQTLPGVPAARALTEQEQMWARVAWRYFENNTDPVTGLAQSVEKFPSTTMWDTASYLLAVIAAHELKLIDVESFDARIAGALASLQRLPLFDGRLPNKSYHTSTLAMVNYDNSANPRGIGWSATDLSRLLVPLNVLVWRFPQHAQAALAVVGNWDTRLLARNGALFGSRVTADGRTELLQEGRLGYEQYAAKTLELMGLDATSAGSYTEFLTYVNVYDVAVPRDSRDPGQFGGARNYVVSEPYVLDGLEFGWDRNSREFAWRVYEAQRQRFERTGVLTAVSEDHLDRPPYFAYNTVYSDGKRWHTLTDTGADAAAFRTLSVKSAFGWHALYRSTYTSRLIREVENLHEPARGWYAGRYEEGRQPNKAFSANTNAVVLESLAYIYRGPVIRYRGSSTP